MDLLSLKKRDLKPLVYDEVVRKDFTLLEVDAELLQEIQNER